MVSRTISLAVVVVVVVVVVDDVICVSFFSTLFGVQVT
jgi:hypothetical protein